MESKLCGAIARRKRAFDAIEKKLRLVGFGEMGTLLTKVSRLVGLGRDRSNQNHRDGGTIFPEPTGEPEPVPLSRRLGVAERNIDRHLRNLQDQKRFVRVPALQHPVAALAQIFRGRLSNEDGPARQGEQLGAPTLGDRRLSFRHRTGQGGEDAGDDVGKVVRLGNKRRYGGGRVRRQPARRHECFEVREIRPQSPDKFESIHRAWQLNVSKDKIYPVSRREMQQGLVRISGLDDAHACLAKFFGNHNSDEDVILDNEHSAILIWRRAWVRNCHAFPAALIIPMAGRLFPTLDDWPGNHLPRGRPRHQVYTCVELD